MAPCKELIIDVRTTYLLAKDEKDSQIIEEPTKKIKSDGVCIDVSPKQSAYFTMQKRWKSQSIEGDSWGTILKKGDLFLLFLEDIKLHPLVVIE